MFSTVAWLFIVAVSATNSSTLEAGWEALAKNNYRNAQIHAENLLRSRTPLTNESKARAFQLLGYAHAGLRRYAHAIRMLKHSLRLKALPQDAHNTILFAIGKAQYASGKPKDAAKTFTEWNKLTPNATTNEATSVAFAFYSSHQYQKAIQWGEKVAKVNRASESLLNLLVAAYLNTQNRNAAIEVLEKLSTEYPENKKYRKRLVKLQRNRTINITWDKY